MLHKPIARVLSSHDRALLDRELAHLNCSEQTRAELLPHWPALAILAEAIPTGSVDRLSTRAKQIGAAIVADEYSDKAVFLGTAAQLQLLGTEATGESVALLDAWRQALHDYGSPRGTTIIGGKEFVWGRRTYLMGILNITPDSFSGDGLGDDLAAAIGQAERFVAEGADIIDVGGESTRPRSERIDAEEELRRVVPIIKHLSRALPVPVSIDTHKAIVAERCIDAGAALLNDIWGLHADPAMAGLIARCGIPAVLMHNQQGIVYRDLLGDIIGKLAESLALAAGAGMPKQQLIIDPGIGFGKSKEQNLEVLHRLDELKVLGRPILLGTSRKSTIGFVLNLPPEDRLEGTAATVALGIALGADIVRVHDVREMARVSKMADAVARWQPIDGEQHWPGQTG